MAHGLLTAPIARSIAKLAMPITAVSAVQSIAAVAEVYFISRLGSDALAGFALVFPFWVLMLAILMGGISTGITSAIARAIGSGRRGDARALVIHSFVVVVAGALLFTLLAWLAGPALYELMGGRERILVEALRYSNSLFGAAILVWLNFGVSAILRGGGDAATPGRVMLISSLAQPALSGVLTLGIGDWPGLGMAGIGLSVASVSLISALLQTRVLFSDDLGLRPAFGGVQLEIRLFVDVLFVGLAASLSALIVFVNAIGITALVGRFGAAALAGYALAIRLEFMLIPLLFGLAAALTTLVGIAVGGNDYARANRVAWAGAAMGGAFLGILGLLVAGTTPLWIETFTENADVASVCSQYLLLIAPLYWTLGIGISLRSASQGAARIGIPLLADIARSVTTLLGGWYATQVLQTTIVGLFAAVAVGYFAFAATLAVPLAVRPWRPAQS